MLQLRNRVIHLILDFRLEIVNSRLKDIQHRLKQAGTDMEQLRELMDEYKQTQLLRNELAKRRGTNVM